MARNISTNWNLEPAVRRRLRAKPEEESVSPQMRHHVLTSSDARARTIINARASTVGKLGPERVDPLYVANHHRSAFSDKEFTTMLQIGSRRNGRLNFTELAALFAAVDMGEERIQECASAAGIYTEVGHRQFSKAVAWIAGKRTQCPSRLQAACRPPCCANAACRVSQRKSVDGKREPTTDECTLYEIYVWWTRKAGRIGPAEAASILTEHGCQVGPDEVTRAFNKVDAGARRMLDFDQFCSFVEDLQATDLIVSKRKPAHAALATDATLNQDDIDSLRILFCSSDANGDGVLDLHELGEALKQLGHHASHGSLGKLVAEFGARDEIDFEQFLALMRHSTLSRFGFDRHTDNQSDFLGSSTLLAEARQLKTDNTLASIGVTDISILQAYDSTGPTVEAIFQCSALSGTPFTNSVLRLHVCATVGYPLQPPMARFTSRLVHPNMNVGLDGNTYLTQLLRRWDSKWSLKKLLRETYSLLREPNLSLLPRNTDIASSDDVVAAKPIRLLESPPGYDLCAVPASNKYMAEVARMFKHHRDGYDAFAEGFARCQLRNANKTDSPGWSTLPQMRI